MNGGDKLKLYLDPGHGGDDPGAVGNGLKEKDITLDIAKRIRNILINNYRNIEIKMSRTGDTTKSLTERTNEAKRWKADYYVSIHCNAVNGNASGYEDYIHSGLNHTSETAKYRDMLHKEITKVNGLRNRGKKKANFHVLRETNMSAFLSENGFISNSADALKMMKSSWRQKVAQGHANGIAQAFNLPRKVNKYPDMLYKVIAGSFESKENAEERVKVLRSKGIDAYILRETISGELWYRVQAGAFASRENAESQMRVIERAAIDVFIFEE